MSDSRSRRAVYLPSALLLLIEANIFALAPLVPAAIHDRLLQIDGATQAAGAVLPCAIVFAVVALLSMAAIRLYSARRSSLPGLLFRVALAMAIATFLMSVLHDVDPRLSIGSGGLWMAVSLAFAAVMTVRIVFDGVLDESKGPLRILVLGAGRRASSIARLRRREDQRGFGVAGYVLMQGDDLDAVAHELRVEVRGTLLGHCEANSIGEIVVAVDDPRRGLPLDQLSACRSAGIRIMGLGAFLERETGGVRLDALDAVAGVQDGRSSERPGRQEARIASIDDAAVTRLPIRARD